MTLLFPVKGSAWPTFHSALFCSACLLRSEGGERARGEERRGEEMRGKEAMLSEDRGNRIKTSPPPLLGSIHALQSNESSLEAFTERKQGKKAKPNQSERERERERGECESVSAGAR